MKKIKFFKADWISILLRFYLLMAIVIAAGFSGVWWLAILALPIFISCMLGISYSNNLTEAKTMFIKAQGSRRTAA